MIQLLPQDLHIHTVFSSTDSSIVPEQTVAAVRRFRHARIIGISDHFECLVPDNTVDEYIQTVFDEGFIPGVEVNGADWADEALSCGFRYFIYHCRDRAEDYRGAEKLLTSGLPVIIAHPHALGTDLNKVPPACYVEINNRYIWRTDYKKTLAPFVKRFSFVISSDAHQPNWLNQHIARTVARELDITEAILFKEDPEAFFIDEESSRQKKILRGAPNYRAAVNDY